MRLHFCFAYGLILGPLLTGPALAVEPDAPERLIARADAVRLIVQEELAKPFRNETDYKKAEHGALVEYYEDTDRVPVWVGENGLTAKARAVIKELRNAANYGLNPSDYDLPEEIILSSTEGTSTPRLAEFEFKMSHAALAYVRHARGGRMAPGTISRNLDPTLDLPDPLELMRQLAAQDDPAAFLRGFHPKHPQFEALRLKLVAMRGGSDPAVKRIMIPAGPSLKPGAKHAHVALLRQRLDTPAQSISGKPVVTVKDYDPGLVKAVKAFQKSHGLRPDGVVGPGTKRALNGRRVPKYRMKTILANMERWRWIPNNLGKMNIQVNIPEFRYRVFNGNNIIHSERVVVGKTKNQTPVFSDQMEYLVFHPYWNVPNSIKIKEILPHLRRGGGGGGWFNSAASRPRILQAHNLFVQYRGRNVDASSINWRTADVRRYRFYQPPGGKNVLGFVKFIFPNKHIVYMHDTSSKSLFNQTSRTFSHGCIRVRNPRKLAEIILGRDRGWSPGNIGSAISSGRNQRVNLNNPIPVNITYFTARVEKNGKITYFGDIYGHDTRMAKALKL
jgi:murein L,D-transpeptidase YcbB/YkuD